MAKTMVGGGSLISQTVSTKYLYEPGAGLQAEDLEMNDAACACKECIEQWAGRQDAGNVWNGARECDGGWASRKWWRVVDGTWGGFAAGSDHLRQWAWVGKGEDRCDSVCRLTSRLELPGDIGRLPWSFDGEMGRVTIVFFFQTRMC